ncbi:MAG: hypothetical protein V1820_02260 [archaeon]
MVGLNLTLVGDLEPVGEIESAILEYLKAPGEAPLEISAAGSPIGSISYFDNEDTFQLMFAPSETSLLAESAKTLDFGKLEVDVGGACKVGFCKYDVESLGRHLYYGWQQVLSLDISKPPKGQTPKIERDGRSFSEIPARKLFNETQRAVYLAGNDETPEVVGKLFGLEEGYDFDLRMKGTRKLGVPGLPVEGTAKVFAQVLVAFRENWVANYLEPAI